MTDEPQPAPHPRALHLDRGSSLTIDWDDGRRSVIPLADLRKACPCAECRGRREAAPSKAAGLPVIGRQADLSTQVKAESAELVGHYALRIRWQDGHDTGIFEFSMLRRLVEASEPG